mmetsp:Transcript_14641/g.61855  ORF Transcript_14641/g.61855 Transcript_14641/m.61855 type:complete len:271 (+) Transcript_14641:630-1442(+)
MAPPIGRRVVAVSPLPFAARGDANPVVEVIHRREQLRHDPALHLPPGALAFGDDGVDLVDEDDGRRRRRSRREELPDLSLGLAGDARDDLRGGDGEEGHPGLPGDGVREGGLAAARGTVEQNAGGHRQAHGLKPRRVRYGLAHGKFELLANLRQGPDVLPGHLRRRSEPLALRRGLHLGQRERKILHGYGEVRQFGHVEPSPICQSTRPHQRTNLGTNLPHGFPHGFLAGELPEDASHRGGGSLLRQSAQIGSHVPRGPFRNLRQVQPAG